MADCNYECTDSGGVLTLINKLQCIQVDGHKSKQPRKIRGMGNLSILNDLPTLTFKTSVKTHADMQLVYDWWCNDLDYGYKPFTMSTYFMGFDKEISVRMTTDLEVLATAGQYKELTFTIEILDDLSTEFGDMLLSLTCDMPSC